MPNNNHILAQIGWIAVIAVGSFFGTLLAFSLTLSSFILFCLIWGLAIGLAQSTIICPLGVGLIYGVKRQYFIFKILNRPI